MELMEGLSEEQKEAVFCFERSVCLSAGAGSGKTRALVARYLAIIERGLASPREIVAITFTEKAATEMKERIRASLRGRAEGGDERAKRFLWQLEGAPIGTIHSFCLRLVRENPAEAAIDPRFGVLDDVASDFLTRAVAEQTLVSALSGERGPSEAAALVVHGLGFEKASKFLREMLRGRLNLEAAKRNFGLDALLPPDLEGEAERVAASMLALYEEATRRYAEEKMRRSRLDFDDLILKAVELLERNPALLDHYRRKFKFVLVDEFQDIDPLQRDLIYAIASEPGTPFPRVRGEEDIPPIPPGKLFIVGDPKQSIYGFRGAEVAVMRQAERTAEGREDLALFRLRKNYRSCPQILGFVNQLFSSLFTGGSELFEEARDFEPEFVPLEAVREGPGGVEVLLVPSGGSTTEQHRNLADLIAGRIIQLVEGGFEVCDPETGERRPLRYGDIAILGRVSTHFPIYERALRARQIPYHVVAGRGFFETQEVFDVLNLLTVVDNPRDEEALLGFLRSPMVGLTDPAITELARLGGGLSKGFLENSLTLGDEENDRRLERARKVWEELRDLRDKVGLAELIEEALERTKYRAALAADPAYRQRLANLRKLIEVARVLEAQGLGSLRLFVRHVAELSVLEARVGEAQLGLEREPAVKLMTIHAAKGLEFPVVFVIEVNRKFGGRPEALLIHPSKGYGLRVTDITGEEVPSSRYKELEPEMRAREIAEEKRLLYVACTRARDLLCLCLWPPRDEKERLTVDRKGEPKRAPYWLLWLEGALGVKFTDDPPEVLRFDWGEVRFVTWGREVPEPPEEEVLQASRGGVEEATRRAREVEKPSWPPPHLKPPSPRPKIEALSFSVTELKDFDFCQRFYEFRHVLRLPEEPMGIDEERWTKRLVGRVVHMALVRLDLWGGPPEPDELVEEALKEARIPLPEVEEAVRRGAMDLLLGFLDSEVAERLSRLEPLFKEAELKFKVEGAMVVAKPDLLAREREGSLVVVDYKTEPREKEEVEKAKERYLSQANAYALACERAMGEPPAKVWMVFLGPPVITPFTEFDFDTERTKHEIAKTIGEIMARLEGRENFRRTDEMWKCSVCPYADFCS